MLTSTTDVSNNATPSSLSSNATNLKVKNYVKELLKSRIFLGRYLERRLCDPRIGYRDVVLLSPAEVALKRDLIYVQNELRLICPAQWIGITDGESIGHVGLCIWTEIDNQPFGPFWFQIRNVKFRDDEVILTVKCLRQITDSFLEIEPMLTGSTKRKSAAASSSQQNTNSSADDLNVSYNDIVETLKGALSIRNVKEFITFLCALVLAVFTGSSAFINFLGNFILALVREMSFLIKNSTPLFLGCLEFMSKVIGGFYILLAMFFRPSNPVPIDRRSLKHHRNDRSFRINDYNYDTRRMSDSHDITEID